MGKMIDGEWTTKWYSPDQKGRFQREATVFDDWVRRDGSTRYSPESGRYHLYIARACPWAHRTAIARELLGLQDVIDVSIVHPYMSEDGWHFDADEPDATEDRLFGEKYLRDVYLRTDDKYTGRVTVPVLWDREYSTIVNNESRDIIEMFDREFVEPGSRDVVLFPDDVYDEVQEAIDAIYEPINNGVYSCGFASSQEAYDEAVERLFRHLDHWEGILADQKWMCGDRFTAADICMFTTLLRFDPVYYVHFKTSTRRVVDYPNLWNYTKSIVQMPGIAKTINMDHIRRHYYQSHPMVNPKGFVAAMPDVDYYEPHDRDRFDR